MKLIRYIRFWIAWCKWFLEFLDPSYFGHPSFGKDRATRNENLRILAERLDAKAPRRQDYGL